jgi:hypothetical protein
VEARETPQLWEHVLCSGSEVAGKTQTHTPTSPHALTGRKTSFVFLRLNLPIACSPRENLKFMRDLMRASECVLSTYYIQIIINGTAAAERASPKFSRKNLRYRHLQV